MHYRMRYSISCNRVPLLQFFCYHFIGGNINVICAYCVLSDSQIMWHVDKSQSNTNKLQQLVDSNMHPVSAAQLNHNLSLLNYGHSGHDISSHIGLHHTTISIICRKHCPDLQNVLAGHPPKLSEANTCYAQHLITSRKAENATQITQILQQVTNQKPFEKGWYEGCHQGKKAFPHQEA